VKRALAIAFLLLWPAISRAEELDIFDRPVAPQVAGTRPVLVLYANRATRRGTGEPADELALKLHDVPYITVVRVDLRGIPSFLGDFSQSSMRDAYRENVERSARLYRDAGLATPAELGHTLVMIGDPNGASHAAVGLAKGFGEAVGVVLDSHGNELFRGAFPRELPKFEEVLRRSASKRAGAG
jgi:hypothetical protein